MFDCSGDALAQDASEEMAAVAVEIGVGRSGGPPLAMATVPRIQRLYFMFEVSIKEYAFAFGSHGSAPERLDRQGRVLKQMCSCLLQEILTRADA